MSVGNKINPLVDTLERLEQQLEVPHISGELNNWASDVVSLLKELEHELQQAVASEHARSFQMIVKSNRNLRSQVDKLAEEDQAILNAFPTLLRQAEQLVNCIREDALAEQQFHEVREKVVQEGLAFVLRARRQQVGVDTWLAEALQRDNGVGD